VELHFNFMRCRRPLVTRIAALGLGLHIACGGEDHPTAPTRVLQPAEVAAGTVLTVVSGEGQRPIAGATIVVGDRRYATDGSGEARLAAPVVRGTLVDLMAPGFLDRQTTMRAGETRFALWPRTSSTGLSEHTTAELVYTPASSCCPAETLGDRPLRRLASTISTLPVVLDPRYEASDFVRSAAEEAMRLASNATQGRVAFAFGDAAAAPRVLVTTGPDPQNRDNIVAFADRTYNGQGYVTGGRIVFVMEDYLTGRRSHRQLVTVLAHELGHILGLEHSSAPGVMSVFDGWGTNFAYFAANGDFSPAEKLVLDLMFQRRAGTRFPDNDRTASVSSTVERERIFCAY
jgi:hypothetical protein